MTNLYPVILCGDSGTLLWPLSRKSFPKLFVKLGGNERMFHAAANRLSGTLDSANFQSPIVMTISDFRFIVVEQLQEIGIDPGAVIIEPSCQNSAPAVLAAAFHASSRDPYALVFIAQSDHVMTDPASFHAAISEGIIG